MIISPTIGPLLFSLGADASGHRVAAVAFCREDTSPPALVVDEAPLAPVEIDRLCGYRAWRWEFIAPVSGAGYVFDGEAMPVVGDLTGDLRVGYVSCNGQEHGDFERPDAERNAMWSRLALAHEQEPLALLLQGGDQVYADSATDAHPTLAAWRAMPETEADRPEATPEMEEALLAAFFEIWRKNVAAIEIAPLLARVPSVMMWDDHDICDGWGSRRPEFQDGPVGQLLFRVARRIFRLFQAGGSVSADAATFSTARRYPGLSILAPDLRAERLRTRVMGPKGWAAFEQMLEKTPRDDRVFIMSSVPALGPRLSLLERIHTFIPGAQKYEDDLRDQWQSRAHRDEWRRFLAVIAARIDRGGPTTVVSGEIHLATRGEMTTPGGGMLHQLTASGVSHLPPPRGFATALGIFAQLGDTPLDGCPISLRPIPGTSGIYRPERNTLTLVRRDTVWSAVWDCEDTGLSDALTL